MCTVYVLPMVSYHVGEISIIGILIKRQLRLGCRCGERDWSREMKAYNVQRLSSYSVSFIIYIAVLYLCLTLVIKVS